ncbi:hypothetical protein AALB16_08380 [Lachnospiraceae bacterium 62-35]
MAETFKEKVRIYGNPEKLTSVVATVPPIHMEEIERPELADKAEEKLLEFCRQAVRQGADVLIPGEGMLNEFAYTRGLTHCGGIPILDGYAVLWQYAKMMHELHKTCNLHASRRSCRKPDEKQLNEMRQFHKMYHLTEADFS